MRESVADLLRELEKEDIALLECMSRPSTVSDKMGVVVASAKSGVMAVLFRGYFLSKIDRVSIASAALGATDMVLFEEFDMLSHDKIQVLKESQYLQMVGMHMVGKELFVEIYLPLEINPACSKASDGGLTDSFPAYTVHSAAKGQRPLPGEESKIHEVFMREAVAVLKAHSPARSSLGHQFRLLIRRSTAHSLHL